MADYTTTELLATVKQRASLPSSQTTFTDTKLLRFANEELRSMLVPFIMAEREEYFVAYKDFAITASTSQYRIPDRAIGGKLRDVRIIDTAGCVRPVPRMNPVLQATTQSGCPLQFYLEGNQVTLYPTPNTTQNTLRLFYYQRPGELVVTTAVGTVSAIGTTTITLAATAPTGFGSSATVDFIRANPGFETHSIDQTCTVSGTTLTFSSGSIPSTLAVGDYVCLSGQSPVAQIPYELHTILAQRVCIKVLEALGDSEGLQRAREQLKEMEQYQTVLIANRVDGKPKVIFSSED